MTVAINQAQNFISPDDSLTNALNWAARGRPVFPIWPINPLTLQCTCPKGAQCGDKHPILKLGHNSATTDPKKIRDLWRRAKYRMNKVAQETGQDLSNLQPAIGGGTQGLIVLDIDSSEGYRQWETVQNTHGRAPKTLTTASGRILQDTGGHGAHIAFAIPANLPQETRDRLTIWGNGRLDGRANGKGWVVLPPTLHRTGHRYIITDDSPIADAPGWLVDFALAQIAAGKGKGAAKGAKPTAPYSPLSLEAAPLPPVDSLFYALGAGVTWKPSTHNDRTRLLAALNAADPDTGKTNRPSIERLKWLSIIWSLRAHERFWRDGVAHKIALWWSRQFASHTDESFYKTVWEREPDEAHPHVGRQRLYDLADMGNPGWSDALVTKHSVDPAPGAWQERRADNGLGAVGAFPSGMGAAGGMGETTPPYAPQAPSANPGQNGGAGGGMGGGFGGGPSAPPPNPGPALVLSRTTPSRTAEQFRAYYMPTLLRTNGDFMAYENGAYVVVEEEALSSRVRSMLDRAYTQTTDQQTGERVNAAFNPKAKDVSEVVTALRDHLHRNRMDRPQWLNGVAGPKASSVISFPNGLLDTETGELLPPNQNFFTRSAREFNYDRDKQNAERWLAFLRQVFAGKECEEKIRLLRQIMGCLVSGDISFQKIFMLLGPKRSGKGTILKVIAALVGMASVFSTTFSSLTKTFGFQGMIGKSVVLIPDAHMGSRTDRDVVVENLKSISGGDIVTASRKYASDWTGVLDARFIISANAMPELADVSAALASRFVTIQTTTSFEGVERRRLYEEDIEPELPAIMNWALGGLADLRQQDRFTLTDDSREVTETMVLANNPIAAYAQERLVFEADARVAKSDLYNDYRQWCFQNGEKELSSTRFAKSLRTFATSRSLPLKGMGKENVKHQAADGKRKDAYEGVRLATG